MEQLVGLLARWGSSVLMQGPPGRLELLGSFFLTVLGFVMVLFLVVQGAQGDPLTALGVVGLALFAFGSFLLQSIAVRLAYQRILHGRG